jgi:hypothetical protein
VRRVLFQCDDDRIVYRGGFSAAGRPLGQQGGDDHEVVGEHRGANERRKRSAPSARQRFMPRPRISTDATLDVG